MTTEKGHPVFEAPDNPNIKIWRYMDFTKYVSLLETQSLYFSRSDLFNDPYEGSTSHANATLRQAVQKDLPSAVLAQLRQFAAWVRQWTYVNCWHMNNYESAAMWNLYAKTNEAIAVQSTYARLRECLPENIRVGKVHYIDYETDWLPEGNSFYPFVHKRKSFSHEQELRAVIQNVPHSDKGITMEQVNQESGKLVNVDLKNLVEKIYVAPTAPMWFVKLVESVTRKYGFEIPVTISSLDKKPFF